MFNRKFLFYLLCMCFSLKVGAQIHSTATVQNMHLWRGIEVADGLVLTTDTYITDKNEHFRFGVWGGTNVTGTYKEFNHYASYSYKGFSLSFWDTYNFSPGASYNNEAYFNYKPRETGRFLDAIVSYRFNDKFPLLLNWSTIVFGRDRNVDNTANKYSTFCYVEYPVYCNDIWTVDAGVGGAFALNNVIDSSHFYGDKTGIVHITLKVSKTLNLGEWKIPFFTCATWNPLGDKGFLQIGIQLFSF
ncbi:MAG: hypothetical protein EZS26_003076 [Candidatus Ordinivivax streblomastigis]|uniref:Uncharacterized protein n=1 Tax=Candidatus Ordinivivax streblomastigis TaxID=2540710 RepID=A0A5M8NXX9_9BACT|nr:MAG: hypothetical protein EZS26_003076 [Candidatus Ordinivivax streblomastigis]